MGVGAQHGLRIVPESACDDVQRHRRDGRERERRARMPEDVQGAGWDASRLAMTRKPFSQALGMNGTAELVAEDEIMVLVGRAGEIPLQCL